MPTEAITLTKGEFNQFWDAVLGDAWYIEEWDADDEAVEHGPDSTMLTLTVLDRGWQGSSDPATNEWLTRRDLETNDTLPVLRRWLARQEMRQVSAFIPASAVGEFEAFLARVGGQPG